MKSIYNEEKILKRYLKNHVSLSMDTMVKFLITGMIGVSLTACGGGGGGGSSDNSTPPVKPPVVEPEQPNMGKPEDSILPEIGVDKTWDLEKEVQSLSGEKFNQLLSEGKIYEKDGKYYIVVDEENKVAQEVVGDSNMGKPEDSILPDMGVDKAWDLEKEVQNLDGEKFTQLLSEGKIYEKDGKYYIVVDEENKVAQEVVVDPNMGKPEDSILPDMGVDKAWDLEKEVQSLDGEKFTQLLSEGKIYEKDGKYYIVVDEENKVAQEVVVDPNMGKPEDSILPEIGVDKAWDLKDGVQELEGSEFNRLLSEGKIYEKDGKYYIVVDEENKVVQEVSSKDNIIGEQDLILNENKEHTYNNTVLYKVSNSTVTVSEETTLAVKGDKAAAVYAVDTVTKAELLGDRTTVVENKGNIDVTGHNSVGMVSKGETTKVINSGTIVGVSEEREDIKTYIYGMAAVENGLAENNGSIKIEGAGVGMLAQDKGTVENKGNIVVEGNGIYLTDSEGNIIKDEKGSTGIRIEDNSVGINDGKIETVGSFNNGMYTQNKGTIINNGEIKSSSSVVYVDDSGFDSMTGEFIEERGIGYSYETVMEGRENSYIENNGTLTGEGSVFGVVARFGSEGINKGNIDIQGKVEKYEGNEEILNNNNDGTHMVSFAVGMRARDNSAVINEGNINIIGGLANGIDARRQSEGVNKGNIYLESTEYLETYAWVNEDGKEEKEDEVEHTWLTGMRGSVESKVVNEKNISLKGKGTAIGTYDKSEGINKGDLELESVEYLEPYSWIDEEGVEHTKEELNHTWLNGMEAYLNSKVLNEKNIYLKGEGTGLRATENSEGKNNGTIIGESIIYTATTNDSNGNEIQEERETWITGMEANKNSTIENNGLIQILGSGRGMAIYENSEGINNNLISVEGKSAIGAEISNSGKFINSENGSIEVKATKDYAAGVRAYNYLSVDQEIGTSIIENHGKIRVEKVETDSELDSYAGASVIGINAQGGKYNDENGNVIEIGNVEVINTGLVHVVGDKGIGISVENGSLVNSGEILLEGKNTTALNISGTGKLVNTSNLEATGVGIRAQNWDMRQENSVIENEGNIAVVGNGEIVIKNPIENYPNQTNAAKGIEGNGSDIYNSGDIVATGDGAYLEYEVGSEIRKISTQAAQGIFANNSTVVKNDGNILVTGESQESWNGAKGIYASGKSSYDETVEYEKVKVENTGAIEVNGKYGVGIGVQGGDLVNTGKIDVNGVSSKGISLSNSYNSKVISKVENEGDITATGDGEKGSESYYSLDAAQGISSNGVDLKNSGNITVIGDGKEIQKGAVGIFATGTSDYDSSTDSIVYKKVSVENAGQIKVNGTYAQGIVVELGDLINTGKIDVNGVGSVGLKVGLSNAYPGIQNDVNRKIENEGDITVTGDGALIEKPGISYKEQIGAAIGIEARETDVYNSGKIEVTGDAKYTNDGYLQFTSGVRGIKLENPFYGGATLPPNKTLENLGDIVLTGKGQIKGIETGGVDILNTGNIVINNGKLETSGVSYGETIGIDASSVKNFKNTGNIEITREGQESYLGAIGVNLTSSASSLDVKLFENTGNIKISSNNGVGIKTDNDIVNLGDINIVGENGVAITLSNYSDSNTKIENEGNIFVQGDRGVGINGNRVNNSGNITLVGNNTIGIKNDSSGEINHIGQIVIEGNNSYGIISSGNLNLDGKIIMTGDNNTGIVFTNWSSLSSSGLSTVELTGKGVLGAKYSVENTYERDLNLSIKIDGEGTGLELERGDLNFKGEIIIDGSFDSEGSVGILTKNNYSINNSNGYIYMNGKNMVGIKGLDSANITNGESAVINISGENAVGISSYNYSYNRGVVTNNGKIEVESYYDARGIDSYGNDVINNGIINVKGTGLVGGFDSAAIRVQGFGATATNNGTINVAGTGTWGMYAGVDGTAINAKDGVINVSATAEGAMVASGGTAINHGTINIEAGNTNTNIVDLDAKGNEVIKSAMYATNGGTIENYGTINSNGDLTLGSTDGGAYVIGTSEDGSYGKISAKNVSIDGDVVVSAGITKNGFKNEYTMQNVVDAEDIKLGDNFNFTSNSLLYDASAVTDRWGNLDATLSRNDKTLSDFTTGYITSTANIFGKYQNEDSFKTLSSDAKEVIKAIDTSSVESINETLNGLTPTIYANLGRQILETSETFKEQDMVAINSLGENSYNFTFIGEYQDVDSRDNIEGYKSKMSGFVGAMNFGDGTFGTIGYGYNAVDYKDNGKGHIQTIHLGLNRLGKYEGVDYKFGIGGEYNFHENKRDIDLLGRRAESDFDSYGVRASGEVSKVFGEKAYVKPYLGLDLAHMKYDSFTESNANSLNANVESENYTSVLPKVGFVVGDRFHGLDLFAGVEYSYELGNMDKEQNFSYEGFEGSGKLPKDSLECGTTGVKAGASYEVNNFTLGASVGKNFGRRDNSFVNMSLGYRF
ncbi:hypothetical protein [Candidatus Cetobacterium colombiensis]|uniref:Autotransporter domain-containing protein n=1 Tax=Candidatus Cetobacterium colombiensis TaxID=3073100 RepID=A0ABU4WDS4_9FUSO|nr:hypothetical protein [Candidatus Cetobacterium colombiensis]MDX8337177.1 hypothetical protein [Candidatus Cetobacterium colombiensis]